MRKKIAEFIQKNAFLIFLCAISPGLIFLWIGVYAALLTIAYVPPFRRFYDWANPENVRVVMTRDHSRMDEISEKEEMGRAIVGFVGTLILWVVWTFVIIFVFRYLTSFF